MWERERKKFLEDIRKKSIKELEELLDELKLELMRLRFKKQVQGLDNPMEIRKIKRNIARVLTVIREKQLRGEQ
ncbi:MAG TPA: 50S ribosomal protein L29 [Aquificaceae bacterium]|nr:50S ribosomal protein L29 [Aquificaceae bacterium]HIQ49320.1 50S ribosomal protein L29 [Aquifex aeolicus]